MPLVSISGTAFGLVKGMVERLENCSLVMTSPRHPLVPYLRFGTASALAKICLRSVARFSSVGSP